MDSGFLWDYIYAKDINPAWSKPGTDMNIEKLVKELLRDYPGQEIDVIDIGCGNGRNSMIYDNIGIPVVNYVGIDFAEVAIEYCKKTYGSDKIFMRRNITGELDSPQKKFHLIVDCGCFHSIEPELRQQYINNVLKLSKKGTIYIICSWYKKEKDPDITKPRFSVYSFLNEWFFNQDDIIDLFSPDFTLKSTIRDTTTFPDLNNGLIYFVLYKQ
ncbi:MAG: class I SAM-dependent methyltransferase [bacterium]|nr:class I SAM-dependent methyltransferase [bacterium]